MSIQVKCKKCSVFLGEIRDAKLHKDIIYLCKNCNTQREALELRYRNKDTEGSFGGMFGDIFGGKL